MAPSKVNQTCSEIIEKVNLSGLDYTMNLTPYSIHFSIRKKFSKVSQSSEQARLVNSDNPSQNDLLQQELLNTRKEYLNLLNFFQIETESKSKLEAELIKETEIRSKLEAELGQVYQKLQLKEETQSQTKKLKVENCELQTNFKNKCLENNHLKNEIDTLKQDKNVLSVALKRAKKEIKETEAAFKRERLLLEKKNEDLNEYRTKKLNEEREDRNRKRKEFKRLKKKNKLSPLIETSKDDETAENTESEQSLLKIADHETVDKREKKIYIKDATTNDATEDLTVNDDIESDPNGNRYEMATIETVEARESEGEPEPENDQEFIGPKLLPQMNKAEIKAFYGKVKISKLKGQMDILINVRRNK